MSSPVLIDLDKHVIPFDLDRKTLHACRRWRASHGAGLDVEVREELGDLVFAAIPGKFSSGSLQLFRFSLAKSVTATPKIFGSLRASSAMEHLLSWTERSDQEVEPGMRLPQGGFDRLGGCSSGEYEAEIPSALRQRYQLLAQVR